MAVCHPKDRLTNATTSTLQWTVGSNQSLGPGSSDRPNHPTQHGTGIQCCTKSSSIDDGQLPWGTRNVAPEIRTLHDSDVLVIGA